ncbi:MAG: PKD domain-containing protein [Parvularculaceae bacterium]
MRVRSLLLAAIAVAAGLIVSVSSMASASAKEAGGACTNVNAALNESVCFSSAPKKVEINPSRSSCTAPCGVHFDATPHGFSTKKPFFELSYIWNFGDADKPFESLPEDFPQSRSENAAQGPYAAHVFDKPGDYKVRLSVTNANDEWAIAETVIHVASADEKYSNGKTVCYSAASNFDGCPDKAKRMSSLPGAVQRLTSARSGRLLLRAGEKTNIEGQLVLLGGPFMISRFGAGADPEIHGAVVFNRAIWIRNGQDVTIDHIRLTGDYNAATGLGFGPDVGIYVSNTKDFLLYRSSFDGVGSNVQANQLNAFIIADNTITNWWNFGVLVQGDTSNDRIAVIGNSIKQKKDAVSGPGKRGWTDRATHSEPNFADHGPIRMAYVKRAVFYANDLVSRTGWSGNGLDHQPALRLQTSGVTGHSAVIGGNRLEGGYVNLEMVIANAGIIAGLGKTIIERNYIHATGNTQQSILIDFGDTIIRNNLFYTPAVKSERGRRVAVIAVHASPKTQENKDAPIEFINNTVASFREKDERRQLFVDERFMFPKVERRNNVIYFPDVMNAAEFSSPLPLDKNFKPMPGSPDYESASPDPLVFDTIKGALRTKPSDKGAYN